VSLWILVYQYVCVSMDTCVPVRLCLYGYLCTSTSVSLWIRVYQYVSQCSD
jgi:hypothetical protein